MAETQSLHSRRFPGYYYDFVPSRRYPGTLPLLGGSARYISGLLQMAQTSAGSRRASKIMDPRLYRPVADGDLRPWEKKRLNERPIYIRSILFLLALLQTIFHLYYNYDRVYLAGAVQVETSQGPEITTEKKLEINTSLRPHTLVSPWEQVKASTPLILQRVALRSAAMAISGPFIYAIFIRHRAWHLSLLLAQLLWDMPAAAVLSYLPPSPIWLVLQSLYAQFLLLLLWESSNTLFSAFVAQEPLRKGQLLSDESRDPNGTLLNGLQSKREVPKVCCELHVTGKG